MKTKIFILLIFISAFTSLKAQINFEKGYFINNNGEKIECLIKNEDWRSNPEQIKYKLNKSDKTKTIDLNNTSEFGIYESSKFIKSIVRIDLSNLDHKKLTINKEPQYENKVLFLRALVEGKASLYSFQDNNKIKYFYSIDDSNTVQLIYSLYLKSNENEEVMENNEYKKQLIRYVNCKNNSIANLKYNREDLTSYFTNYNSCMGSDEAISYKEKERKGKVNLYAKAGIELTQIEIHDINILGYDIVTEFNDFSVPTFGIELEYILPFKNNKWGTFISFMYRGFKTEGTRNISVTTNNKVKLNYQSIEMSLGIRHYFFLNNSSSIFLEGYPNFSYILNNKDEAIINVYETVEIPSSKKIEPYELNFSLGIGFNLKNAFLKANYFTNNDIFDKDSSIESEYSKIVFTLGYNFL